MKISWDNFHNKETNIIMMMIKKLINKKTQEYNGNSNN